MHSKRDLPCQDACAFGVAGNRGVVIVVADGLGSAAKSEIGASIAVGSAFQYCTDAIATTRTGEVDLQDIVRDAAAHARNAMEMYAQERSCELRDLACTLIVVMVLGSRLVLAHIGDGAVVTQGEAGFTLVSGPEESEYTNEVVPLTTAEWQPSLRIKESNSALLGVAVLTDGCQRAAFLRAEGTLVPFDKFFGPVFDYARQTCESAEGSHEIVELLSSAKLCEHSDDDKTLVVAVMRPE